MPRRPRAQRALAVHAVGPGAGRPAATRHGTAAEPGTSTVAGPLDWALVDEIRRFEAEVPGLLEGMVQLFLETVPKHRAALGAALAAGDAAGVRAAAHALKGSALQLGGVAIGARAEALEQAAGAGRLEGAAAAVAGFDRDLEALCEALAELVAPGR